MPIFCIYIMRLVRKNRSGTSLSFARSFWFNNMADVIRFYVSTVGSLAISFSSFFLFLFHNGIISHVKELLMYYDLFTIEIREYQNKKYFYFFRSQLNRYCWAFGRNQIDWGRKALDGYKNLPWFIWNFHLSSPLT